MSYKRKQALGYIRTSSAANVGDDEDSDRRQRVAIERYLRSEDGRGAGGVYLWETRAAAEAVYNSEWKARVKQLYGSEPDGGQLSYCF
jgi:hypothetical protein